MIATSPLQAPAMTPVQILRAVLKCLSDERTLKPSYFMERGPEGGSPLPPPPLNFRGSAEVIFVEPSGWVNIAAHASKAALIQVGCFGTVHRREITHFLILRRRLLCYGAPA